MYQQQQKYIYSWYVKLCHSTAVALYASSSAVVVMFVHVVQCVCEVYR